MPTNLVKLHFYHPRIVLTSRECVTRFSTSSFIHDSNPSGQLINRLKYFRIWFRYPRDILSQSFLRGVQHTAEMISAVCNILQKSSPRCTPRRSSPGYVAHHWDSLRGVQQTAEIISTVCITPPRWYLWTP